MTEPPQKHPVATAIVILGLVLLALSVPCPWISVTPDNAFRMEGFPGGPVDETIGETSVIHGGDGYLQMGIAWPIWLFVGVGAVGQFILLARLNGLRSHPKVVILAPFAFALFFTLAAIYYAIRSDQATFSYGGFVALAGLLIGLVPVLFITDEPAPADHPPAA